MLTVKFSAFISFLHRQMLATVIVLYILKLGGIVNFPGYSLSILYKVRVNGEFTQQDRRAKERWRQTLCDKDDNKFVWKNLLPNFTFF